MPDSSLRSIEFELLLYRVRGEALSIYHAFDFVPTGLMIASKLDIKLSEAEAALSTIATREQNGLPFDVTTIGRGMGTGIQRLSYHFYRWYCLNGLEYGEDSENVAAAFGISPGHLRSWELAADVLFGEPV